MPSDEPPMCMRDADVFTLSRHSSNHLRAHLSLAGGLPQNSRAVYAVLCWEGRWTKDGFASCWGTPCSTVQSSPGSLLPDCGDGGGGDDHTGAVEELVGCGSQVLRARRDTQPSGSTVVGRWSGGALEEPRFRGAWTGRGWGNHISSTPSGTSSSPPRVVGMNEGPHVRGCSGHRTMPKALGRSAPSTLRREYPYPTNQPNPAG